MPSKQTPLGRGWPCGGVTNAHSRYPFCSVRLLTQQLEHIQLAAKRQAVGTSLAKHLVMSRQAITSIHLESESLYSRKPLFMRPHLLTPSFAGAPAPFILLRKHARWPMYFTGRGDRLFSLPLHSRAGLPPPTRQARPAGVFIPTAVRNNAHYLRRRGGCGFLGGGTGNSM